MLENNQNVGYSMPRQNGLYPPPPIIYKFTETFIKIEEIYTQNGTIPNYLKSQSSKIDISDVILKDAVKDLGGFYAEYDMVLPNGKILE